jgi:hypothetical protein
MEAEEADPSQKVGAVAEVGHYLKAEVAGEEDLNSMGVVEVVEVVVEVLNLTAKGAEAEHYWN